MKIERPQITLVQCRFEFSGAKMALLGVKVWQINGISSNCQLSIFNYQLNFVYLGRD